MSRRFSQICSNILQILDYVSRIDHGFSDDVSQVLTDFHRISVNVSLIFTDFSDILQILYDVSPIFTDL